MKRKSFFEGTGAMTSEVITGSMESLFLLDALVDHLVPRQTFLHF